MFRLLVAAGKMFPKTCNFFPDKRTQQDPPRALKAGKLQGAFPRRIEQLIRCVPHRSGRKRLLRPIELNNAIEFKADADSGQTEKKEGCEFSPPHFRLGTRKRCLLRLEASA